MTYYHHVRREIMPLLPENANRILDVGTGAGGTLKWLKSIFPNAATTGVELNFELMEELRRNADVAIIGSVDQQFAQLKTYDLILLLDVLEHVADPISTLRKIVSLLEPRGHVIVSVPNIAHFSVSIPLLLQGRFTYKDAGILDRTHLRFFVEDSAIKLLNDAGLVVTKGMASGMAGSRAKVIDRLSFGMLRRGLAKRYIMLGELATADSVQRKVRWMVDRMS
jgi:2-polyprenyl-3-methyl-5-hydroxy-6-metoxy-1,4-benzoquinol methylase